jgi:hypothetical protein
MYDFMDFIDLIAYFHQTYLKRLALAKQLDSCFRSCQPPSPTARELRPLTKPIHTCENPTTLILAPTRELVSQIHDEAIGGVWVSRMC